MIWGKFWYSPYLWYSHNQKPEITWPDLALLSEIRLSDLRLPTLSSAAIYKISSEASFSTCWTCRGSAINRYKSLLFSLSNLWKCIFLSLSQWFHGCPPIRYQCIYNFLQLQEVLQGLHCSSSVSVSWNKSDGVGWLNVWFVFRFPLQLSALCF